MGGNEGRTLRKTRKRVLTRRGVVWLGQTCNLRCFFCYFAARIADRRHPEHDFMTLDKARRICHVLRAGYGNTSVDIQGGEPTIYPDILDLVRYCREIGLYPTLITNGLVLGKPGAVERYRDAGLRDFLVSLHGVGKRHDEVVRVDGAYNRIEAAIERMRTADIPFRINCTMTEPVAACIPDVARKSIEYGALAVNFIGHNPFADQSGERLLADGVARYSELAPHLTEALDMLEAADIEANVRYLPLCVAEPRHRKNFYDYQQLPYDTHEWDFESWSWTLMSPQVMREGELVPWFRLGLGAYRIQKSALFALRDSAQQHPARYAMKFRVQHALARCEQLLRGRDAVLRDHARTQASEFCRINPVPACWRCALRTICDGFHHDYVRCFGDDEAKPLQDMPNTDDPTFFIRDQDKFVEAEDAPWAL